MPRTLGAIEIRGWRKHGLIRDLAAGTDSVEVLAERYSVHPSSVYGFKDRHASEIAAVLADWSDEFSDLWSVKKHNRIADLQGLLDGIHERMAELLTEAERATEEMRRVMGPDSAPVLVPGPEWRGYVREAARLEHQIADEMGQLSARIGKVEVVASTEFPDVLVEDENGVLGRPVVSQ
jgi:hypothetical protein